MDKSPAKDLSIEEICKLMPKVELHAHLNGSISSSILQRLTQNERETNSIHNPNNPKRVKFDEEQEDHKNEDGNEKDGQQQQRIRSLSECWIAFGKIHKVVQKNPEILFQATCEVIKDFAKDQVIYLEIRTTPKKIFDIPSKKVYIETVIKAIKHCMKELPSIVVKLLISLDRADSSRNYLENICLAEWYRILYPDIVVGLDLCGHPAKGTTKQIMFALNFARKFGQKISIHLPEIVNVEETKEFLKFCPNRVAHGHFLHESTGGTKELWSLLKRNGRLMEAAITSNIITGVSPTLEEHYIKLLHEENIPFAICTDDSGVFNTSLTKEYLKFLQLVPLSKEELKSVSICPASHIFGSLEDAKRIKAQIENWWKTNVNFNSENVKK